MRLKEKYLKRFKEIVDKLNLNQSAIEQIEKNYYLPIISYIFEDEIIFKEKNLLVYKKGNLIGFKLNDFLIKLIISNVLDEPKKSLVIPFSLDEGEELLINLMEEQKGIYDFIDIVFSKLSEKEKKVLYKNIDKLDDDIKYYVLRNYPLLTRINGILDDVIMKILEKMTNNEIVTLMLMMDIPDRKKILRNISKGRKKIILEELSYIHYFRKSERQRVKNKFFKLLKQFMVVEELK